MQEYKVTRTITEVHYVEASSEEAAREAIEYAPTEWLSADIEVSAKAVRPGL